MKKLFNTLYVTNKDAYVCKKDDNACHVFELTARTY